ncbi:MAG: ATP-dependent DNA ligase [Gemmatimonadota bacterium]
MHLAELVAVSQTVAETGGRLDKIARLAALLGRLEPDEIEIAIGFLTGWPRQGRIGIGWAALNGARPETAAEVPSLTLGEVDLTFDRLKAVTGKGSAAERLRMLRELYARATPDEQRFLTALAIGDVRHGALEGVMAEAVAEAARLPPNAVRRAVMLAGDLGTVARSALTEGADGIARYQVELFRPLQPMLADSAPDLAEALASQGRALLEWKLDGARIQVHKSDQRVAVYTRSLNDVTAAVPEVVEAVLAIPARSLILDGEVIALGPDRRPLPFQDTMRRFGRKLDVASIRAELPIAPFFFDLLFQDGELLLDQPLSERMERLRQLIAPDQQVPGVITDDIEAALRFEAAALGQGHEGLMAKSLAAPYAAGRRGSAWLKIKKARTLDLVVLAAEWGSGRRKGWLSNLHLGARNPDGGFVMLGKTFKGMTDEVLEWQTRELLARESSREDHIVWVRPELVVEVAFNEVQQSSQYPGGVALRFARIKGYRPDKPASEADTIAAVRALGPAPGPPKTLRHAEDS